MALHFRMLDPSGEKLAGRRRSSSSSSVPSPTYRSRTSVSSTQPATVNGSVSSSEDRRKSKDDQLKDPSDVPCEPPELPSAPPPQVSPSEGSLVSPSEGSLDSEDYMTCSESVTGSFTSVGRSNSFDQPSNSVGLHISESKDNPKQISESKDSARQILGDKEKIKQTHRVLRSGSATASITQWKERDNTNVNVPPRRRNTDSTTTTTSRLREWTFTTTAITTHSAKTKLDGNNNDNAGSSKPSKKTSYKEEDEYVGFATLPEQVHRKAIKRGFDFVLMVVGETGLGKSTLVGSLFTSTRQMAKAMEGETGMGKSTLVSSLILNDLYKDRKVPSVEERVTKTVHIEKKHMEIEEKGVKLRLTIVDTPGFNDSVNAEDCWKPIETYIDDQFDQYFKDESGLNRKNIKDNRVHCCLYFIPPYGHGLRQIDVQFMRRLHEKVNIVPVIAKSDTLTLKEVKNLKSKILDQIEQYKIKIYEFPECDSDEDEEFKQQDSDLKAAIPFAVIGSNTVVEVGGRRVRGRLYPWGIVEVDNPKHCDFGKLRQMLISTHMQDLKDVTRDCHYEGYRARHIKNEMNINQRDRNQLVMDPVTRLCRIASPDEDDKLKRDSSPNFEAIMDTERLLEQKDIEIRRMQEMLMKMQQQLGKQPPGGRGNAQVNGKAVNGLGNL